MRTPWRSAGSHGRSTVSRSRSSSRPHVRVLGVEGTAKRLGEALALLTRTAPDLPERQRSLRATVEWSVRLLDDDRRHVLTALAAFPGGATLEALEAVAEPGTDVATALDASWTRASRPRR